MKKNYKKIKKAASIGSMAFVPALVFTTYELAAQNDRIENHLPDYLKHSNVSQQSLSKEIHSVINNGEHLNQSPKNIIKSGATSLMSSNKGTRTISNKLFVDNVASNVSQNIFSKNYNFTVITKGQNEPSLSDHDVRHLPIVDEWHARGFDLTSTKLFQDSKGRFWGFSKLPYAEHHLIIFGERSGDFMHVQEVPAGYDTIDKTEGAVVFEDSHGYFWTMGKNNPLKRTTNPNDLIHWKTMSSSQVNDGSYGTIYEDSNNRIWVLAPGMPLRYTDDFGDTWSVPSTSNVIDGWGASIIEDSNGVLWTMSTTQTHYVLNRGTTPTQYSNDGGLTWHSANASCHVSGAHGKFFIDSTGKLWATAEKSPLQYTTDSINWITPTHSNIVDGDDAIITEGRNGELFSKGKGTKLQSSHDGGINWQSGYELLPNAETIKSNIFIDALGTSWVVTDPGISGQSNLHLLSDDHRQKGTRVWLSFESLDPTMIDKDTNIQATPNGDVYFISKNSFRRIKLSDNPAIKNNQNIHNVNGTFFVKQKPIIKTTGHSIQRNPGEILIEGAENLQPYAYLEVKKPGASVWEKVAPSSDKKFRISTQVEGRYHFRFGSDSFNLLNGTNPSIESPISGPTPPISFVPLPSSGAAGTSGPSYTNIGGAQGTNPGYSVTISPLPSNGAADLGPSYKITSATSGFHKNTNHLPKPFSVDTSTILSTPKIITKNFKQPSITTSSNGEVIFELTNYDSKIMRMVNLSNGGTMQSLDAANQTIKLNGFKNGDFAQIAFELLDGSNWPNGTTRILSQKINFVQTDPGVVIPKFVSSKSEPTLVSSTDGEVTFTLSDFDSTTMTISKVAGTDGTLGTYDPTTKTIKVVGLTNGNSAQIQISFKNNNKYWNNGNNAPIKSSIVTASQTKTTLDAPTFSITSYIPASSSTAEDGELTISFSNFNPTKLLAKPIFKNHNHEAATQTGNQMTFTHLSISSAVSIKIEAKPGLGLKYNSNLNFIESKEFNIGQKFENVKFTTDVLYPTSATSTDGAVTFHLENFDSSKMTVTKFDTSGGVLEAYDDVTKTIKITGLKLNDLASIFISLKSSIDRWNSGNREGTITSPGTAVYVDKFGISKPIIKRTDIKSITGSKHNGGFILTVENFDPTSMVIKTHVSSSGVVTKTGTNQYTFSNFDPSEKGSLTVELKPGYKWLESGLSTPVSSSLYSVPSFFVKPTITTSTQMPHTATSSDGIAIFKLNDKFDPTWMNIEKVGTEGTLGTYDAANHEIRITGLSNGNHAQIRIVLKAGDNLSWLDTKDKAQILSNELLMSQTSAGIHRPRITMHKKRVSTIMTSHDGVVKFNVSNFDSNTMELTNLSSAGSISWDNEHKQVVIAGLTNGDHAKFRISLKENYYWIDGTNGMIESQDETIVQTITSLSKPTFTLVSKTIASSISSYDGVLKVKLTNFDPETMNISLVNSSSSATFNYDESTNILTINKLGAIPRHQILISLKNSELIWTGGTKEDVTSTVYLINALAIKPTITKLSVIKPITSSLSNGEVTFKIDNYDPIKMRIEKTSGTDGTLGTYDPVTHTIKVTDLSNGNHVQLKISLLPSYEWQDNTLDVIKTENMNIIQSYSGIKKVEAKSITNNPKTASTHDGQFIVSLKNYDESKMNIKLTLDSSGTLGAYDPITKTIRVKGLSNGDHVGIIIYLRNSSDSWIDGTKDSILLTSEIYANYRGVTLPTTTQTTNTPKTLTASNGQATFILNDFDPNKMTISKAPDSDGGVGTYDPKFGTFNINGLSNGDVAKIQISLINSSDLWENGTNAPITFSILMRSNSYVGLTKPTINAMINPPKTSSTNDGEAIYKIDNFDPNKMDIVKVSTPGTLGAYDPNTKTIRITGLTSGEHVQIQILLKSHSSTQQYWTDGTNHPISSIDMEIIQKYLGLSKAYISSPEIIPPTSTKKGEVIYTIVNYNPNTMSILKTSALGILGEFDFIKHQITISDLNPGESTQIEIVPKNVELWTNGTNSPILSEKANASHAISKMEYSPEILYVKDKTDIKNGIITFKLNNFNPNTMKVMLTKDSAGTIQLFDPITKTVKVLGLGNDDTAEICIITKEVGNKNPALLTFKSELVSQERYDAVHKLISNNKNSERNKIITIASSTIGAILVLPMIWKYSISKWLKKRKNTNIKWY